MVAGTADTLILNVQRKLIRTSWCDGSLRYTYHGYLWNINEFSGVTFTFYDAANSVMIVVHLYTVTFVFIGMKANKYQQNKRKKDQWNRCKELSCIKDVKLGLEN